MNTTETTTVAFHVHAREVGGGIEWRVIATTGADATGRRWHHDHVVVTEAEEPPDVMMRLLARIKASGISPVGRAHWAEVTGVSISIINDGEGLVMV